MICIAGLFNFSQSGLDYLTHQTFQHDPVPVNTILLVVAFVAGAALVGFVGYRSRTLMRENLEMEAEDAEEIVMPGADSDAV